MKWVFFGSSEFSVYALDELKIHDLSPTLIITTPDKPKGRKLILTPTPVKTWAQKNNIEVLDPASLKDNYNLINNLSSAGYDFFLVAAYGKIIPKVIFEIPKYKTLNIHPSLLPKYRGASPIQSQILNNEKEIGVSIMQIDEGVDTGPLLTQREFPISNFQFPMPSRKELEKLLAIEGAQLLAQILPRWLSSKLEPTAQNESGATYCKKIEKKDGELDIDLNNLEKDAYQNFLKIKAFEDWPTAYFFLDEKRIIITAATIKENKLIILRVKPEGKSEMPFEDFLRGQKIKKH